MITDHETPSSLSLGDNWFVATILGPVGTAVAVLAVAGVGIALLQGRIPVRRGAEVVIGCFILFSARTIAGGLVSGDMTPPDTTATAAQMPPTYSAASPAPVPYDPYAGASVPIRPRDTADGIVPK